MAVLASLDLLVGADNREARRKLFQTRRELRNFSRQVRSSFGGIAKASAASTALVVAGFARMAQSTLQATDAQAKMAKSLGITFEGLQTLHHALELQGIGQEKTNKLLLRTNQLYFELERGTSTYVQSLAAIGLSFDDIKNQNNEQILITIAKAMRDAENQTRALGAASLFFGARLAGLLGPLVENADEVEAMRQRLIDLGGTIRDSTGKEIQNLNDNISTLGTVINANFTNALIDSSGAVGDWDAVIKRAGEVTYEVTTAIIDFAKEVYQARVIIGQFVAGFIAFKVGGLVISAVTALATLKAAFLALGGAALLASGAIWPVTVAIAGITIAVGLNTYDSITQWFKDLGSAASGTNEDIKALNKTMATLREEADAAAKVGAGQIFPARDATEYEARQRLFTPPKRTGDTPIPVDVVKFDRDALSDDRLDQAFGGLLQRNQTEGGRIEISDRFRQPTLNDFLRDFQLPSGRGGDRLASLEESLAGVDQIASRERFKVAAQGLFENLQGSLKQALLTGNFKDLGSAFVTSIQSVLIDSLFSELGSALFGGASGGLFSGLFGGTAHEGARVGGRQGQESLWMLEAGEWVLTPQQMTQLASGGGRGGVTINQRLVGDVTIQTREAMRSQAREQTVLLHNEREELGYV